MIGIPKRRTDTFTGTTGIWFLKQSEYGSILVSRISNATALRDIYIPVSPDPLPVLYAYNESTDVPEKLLLEIEAAAVNPLTARAISDVWADLVVGDFGNEPLQRMYARLAASRDFSLRTKGIAGQLRLGNSAGLTAMVTMDPNALPQNSQFLLARAVCEYRGRDSSGVARLAALVESAFPAQTKTCAVYALREIHTKESLPFLAKLLDSSSTDVRYDVMIGIAQYAMSFPVAQISEKPGVMSTYRGDNSAVHREMADHYPSTPLFADHQEQYISYWKAYLASQGVQ